MRARVPSRKAHCGAGDFAGLPAASLTLPDGAPKAGTIDVRQTALGFLTKLFGNKPAETFVLIWLLLGKESHWFNDLGDAAAFVERFWKQDVYVGAALSLTDFGPHRRCKAEQSAGITSLWIDLDIAGEAHEKSNLPPTIEDALSLIPSDLPPSVTVHSGHGVQCWWIFREPWIFSGDIDRARAADLAVRFNSFFKSRAKVRGWDVDSVADLARVLRVPGTTNAKIAGAHRPVYILRDCDRRYSPSELEACLTLAGIASEPAERDRRKAVRNQPDMSWMLNLGANPPVEKFKLLSELEPRFALSWQHRRPDLQDQSPSGYDMSLSVFAAGAGWADGEIIALLIAHRRKYSADLKRPDYYTRTAQKSRVFAARSYSDDV
jgi:hypothetical protein